MSRMLLDFNPEAHGVAGDTLLFGQAPSSIDRRSAIRELDEIDLASRFLEAHGQIPLAQYVGRLVQQTARTARRPLAAPTVAALTSQLVHAARITKAVPLQTNRARLSAPDSPPSAELIYGVELEGLSPEDQEFETARRFVRFAVAAVANATRTAGSRSPAAVAASALHAAARRHAPGLLSGRSEPPIGFRRRRDGQRRSSIGASH